MTELFDPQEAWDSLRLVAVDTEGNGERAAALVEIGVVPIEHGVAGQAASWLVRPRSPILWQATKVHGITDEDVASCPSADQIRAQVAEALGERPIVVAHNAHVEIDMLGRELGIEAAAAVDTLKIARRCFPRLPSHRLADLADFFGIVPGPETGAAARVHRAGYDALLAARLLCEMAQRSQLRTLGQLLDLDPTPALF